MGADLRELFRQGKTTMTQQFVLLKAGAHQPLAIGTAKARLRTEVLEAAVYIKGP
jgi:hypothetical protein